MTKRNNNKTVAKASRTKGPKVTITKLIKKSQPTSQKVQVSLATKTTTISRGQPVMRYLPNGNVRVVHRELLGPVNPQGLGFAVASTVELNPGNSSLSTFLSALAVNFETYVWHKVHVKYVPFVAATDRGAVYITADYDPLDPPPVSAFDAMRTPGAVQTPVAKEATFVARPNDLQKRKEFFVKDLAQEPRSSIAGILYVATEAVATDIAQAGQLWIDYDVELKTPSTSAGLVDSFATQTATNPEVTGSYLYPSQASAPLAALATGIIAPVLGQVVKRALPGIRTFNLNTGPPTQAAYDMASVLLLRAAGFATKRFLSVGERTWFANNAPTGSYYNVRTVPKTIMYAFDNKAATPTLYALETFTSSAGVGPAAPSPSGFSAPQGSTTSYLFDSETLRSYAASGNLDDVGLLPAYRLSVQGLNAGVEPTKLSIAYALNAVQGAASTWGIPLYQSLGQGATAAVLNTYNSYSVATADIFPADKITGELAGYREDDEELIFPAGFWRLDYHVQVASPGLFSWDITSTDPFLATTTEVYNASASKLSGSLLIVSGEPISLRRNGTSGGAMTEMVLILSETCGKARPRLFEV